MLHTWVSPFAEMLIINYRNVASTTGIENIDKAAGLDFPERDGGLGMDFIGIGVLLDIYTTCRYNVNMSDN